MEPQAKRFASVCDSDVDQVIAGRVPQATKEATTGWLRVFHQFADKQETRLYTNDSVRATVVHRLSAAGTPERHIMSATGHKNAQSLQSYARATDNQLDQIASVLDGRAAIAASKNPDVQLDEADMEAAALAVADLDSFPLEPATSVQKSAVSVLSISNDASRHQLGTWCFTAHQFQWLSWHV